MVDDVDGVIVGFVGFDDIDLIGPFFSVALEEEDDDDDDLVDFIEDFDRFLTLFVVLFDIDNFVDCWCIAVSFDILCVIAYNI